MLSVFRRRLVDDARDAWKWGSVRFIALGAVLQGSVVAADRIGLSAHLPDWLLQAVSVIAFVSICCAGVARITTWSDPNVPAA